MEIMSISQKKIYFRAHAKTRLPPASVSKFTDSISLPPFPSLRFYCLALNGWKERFPQLPEKYVSKIQSPETTNQRTLGAALMGKQSKWLSFKYCNGFLRHTRYKSCC